jgi:hypothetical protein
MRRQTAILLLALSGVLLVAGCAQTLQVAVVDARTGRPLSGVSTTWHEHRYNLLTGHLHETGPTNLPPSGDNGVIKISAVHRDWANRLVLARSGFRTVYGGYTGGQLWLSETVRWFPGGVSQMVEPVTEAASTNGCFLAPMQGANK